MKTLSLTFILLSILFAILAGLEGFEGGATHYLKRVEHVKRQAAINEYMKGLRR